MKHLLYLLLFTCSFGYSQAVKDTVFIVFKEGNGQKKLSPKDAADMKQSEPVAVYEYHVGKNHYYKFLRSKYPEYKDLEAGIESKTEFVDMPYLEKHKDKLIDMAYMRKQPQRELFEYLKNKVLYLIDVNAVKKTKIPMYRVSIYEFVMPAPHK